MALEVRVSDPSLLADVVASFSGNACVAYPVGRHSCLVVHVHAASTEEALQEVRFFLRAWELRHPGVSASVTP
jgi:hypothetical protein